MTDLAARLRAANPLAPQDGIANRFPTDNTAGDPSGDLLEDYFPAVALNVERILLVFRRRPAAHGPVELSGAILDGCDASRYRRPVDVHVEYREEHADPLARFAVA